MSELPGCEATPGPQRYQRAIRGAAAGYVVTLLLAITYVRNWPDSAWRYPVMLVPVIPAVYGLVAIMRSVRAMDELQRRVHLEGVAFAFATTVVVTLSWGLLERAGAPKLPSVWVATIMIGLWGIGNRIAARRYR
jgi:hypothetical protein